VVSGRRTERNKVLVDDLVGGSIGLLNALCLLSIASTDGEVTLVARCVGGVGALVVLDVAGADESIAQVVERSIALNLEAAVASSSDSRSTNSTEGTRESLNVSSSVALSRRGLSRRSDRGRSSTSSVAAVVVSSVTTVVVVVVIASVVLRGLLSSTTNDSSLVVDLGDVNEVLETQSARGLSQAR
jgi:hypothetical protein